MICKGPRIIVFLYCYVGIVRCTGGEMAIYR